MKRSHFWLLCGLATAALIAAGVRWLPARAPSTDKVATAPAVASNQVELSASDVVSAQKMTMVIALPVSGTLKASQSAMVKARVSGELMDLVVREGDAVKAGQVIARIDPTEYLARERQAQQQADAAWAQVTIAQKQLDNNKALVDQGFISQTALQNSLASLNGAKATHLAAVAALDVTRKALEDAVVRSPIAGQVAQRLAQPGERMALDARIVEIVNLDKLELEAALPAAEASLVRQGMSAQLQVEGVEEALTAKVLRISPAAQTGNRSVLVYLGLPGHEGLRQGVFAEGQLGTRTVQALAVPLSSVRTDKPQPYVQAVEAGQVRHVTVQTGTRAEKTENNITLTWIEVQGLAEGTQVLAASTGAVREGTLVKFTAGVR